MRSRTFTSPVIVFSIFVGWAAAGEGRLGAAGIPTATVTAQAARPGQKPPAGTKVVQAPPLQAPDPTPAPGNPVAVISTTHGDITVELFNDRAPVSVENFLQYANEGFYAGTIFHRVVPKFMIQGGGFTESLVEKPTRGPIQNEATNGLRNTRGTLAMARRQALRSATSQFYINVADNRMLDHAGYTPIDFGYAVFGRVLSGMDVVDKIAAVQTTTKDSMDDVPVQAVVITGVKVK